MRSDYTDVDPGWTSASPYAFHRASGTAFVCVEGPMIFSLPAGLERFGPHLGIVHDGVLVKTIRELASRPDIRTIAFDVHSPGGCSAGIGDLQDAFALARANGKSTTAIAHDQACSHAMLPLALADTAYATNSATLGSMGTRTGDPIVSSGKEWADAGRSAFYPHVGDHKLAGLPGTDLTEADKAMLQAWVEQVNEPFARAISEGFGISVEAIKALNGAILSAGAAQAAGLLDGVTTFEAWKSALIGRTTPTATTSATDPGIDPEAGGDSTENAMAITNLESLRAAHGDLVSQAEREAVARSAEPKATIDQLESAFPGDPAFVLAQARAGVTLTQARLARLDAVSAELAQARAELAKVREQLSAKSPVPGDAGVAGVDPAARAPVQTFADALRIEAEKAPGNLPKAMLAASRTHPQLFRAWHLAGRPRIEIPA